MRLLVCGSRHLPIDARDWLAGWMRKVAALCGEPAGRGVRHDTLIHGGAQGADLLAAIVAQSVLNWPTEEYAADWDAHGRRAGPMRNQEMIDEGKPDAVLAVLQEGYPCRGTHDMIRRTMAAGIPLAVVTWRDPPA